MNSLSLSELTGQVQAVIRQNFPQPLWVRAEISELRENGGHCYMELIEKEAESGHITAKVRANIWSSTYRMLKPYFESSTGEAFRAGLNVLVSVMVEFNGLYGFSLNVRDIDPVFTIGELAARRLQIIRRLESEGIADMNKQLSFPALPRCIAVISSETAAGYGDFCDQLKSNPAGYTFYTKLFPAIMQGMQAEPSIIRALDEIFKYSNLFDVAVIIRGGGAVADLSCFDSYNLALNCAQFPLPIITGIGHLRDSSILDMVAHACLKTPTAAAEFLISKLDEASEVVNNLAYELHNIASGILKKEEKTLDIIKLKIKQASKTGLLQKTGMLSTLVFRLKNSARNKMMLEKNRLSLLQRMIETHSPVFLAERGYTITTLNGKKLTSIKQVSPGNKITTHLPDGCIDSNILEIIGK